ncbi:MAG: efflux RND transporter permease subunit [Puniceicoccaceae bacterium]|nr:MAG: efflux RND transporter permease subunit [Puniceicoccaceae bacterium]
MILSDISVKRPVFATVLSLLLIAVGLVSFNQLPLREYPDIDPPVVSIDTRYVGAAASVVETRITRLIEDRIAGVEGIHFISSQSRDGRSRISVEFSTDRDIDDAANDIRDRVSGLLDQLPDEADPPDIEKADSSDDVIIWLSLTSEERSTLELTDYARRYLVDRFSILPGVARVRLGGSMDYSMRIWLDRTELAARGLTVTDVEDALRAENVELPAGSIESRTRQFTARTERGYQTEEDFRKLVIRRDANEYLVRLGDVARVEKAAVEDRTFFRGNGAPRIGIGVIKQSTANTIEVADAAIAEVKRLQDLLPPDMSVGVAYDTSVFVRNAISEVYKTLSIAIGLVVLVIWLFLGSARAMLIPAVTIPVALVSTFIVLLSMGFSINLLTLLALVLAIGLVVDDAIVVLENITRRVEAGETPLVAAFHGSRQVGFAVVATSIVLIAVFVPIAFLEGDLGRLFSEFALTMAAAVFFSTFVALTLSAMLASKLLRKSKKSGMSAHIDRQFKHIRKGYSFFLRGCLRARWFVVLLLVPALLGAALFFFNKIPSEYAPQEDRGAFFILVNGPEGASFEYMEEYMNIIEERILEYVEKDEIHLALVRAPRGFGNLASFNDGIVIAVLEPWGNRRSAWAIMDDIRGSLSDLTGVRAFPVMRQGFGGGIQKPVQFVIGGGTYTELAEWRDLINQRIEADNPGFEGLDFDYKETKPQISIAIDRDRAADLGISVRNVGRTLESMLGGRRVTTFIDDGEEYDVILEGDRETQRTPTNMENIYVRSETTGALIPLSNVVTLTEFADSSSLARYNRVRAITLESNLANGYTLGEALAYLENLVRTELPETAVIDYKGQSLDYKSSGDSILFVFALGLFVVYLVLAAQFESWIHPLVIMLTVPLAITGALAGLFFFGESLNIYTQVGLIMLVGLASKNGILIVEFINQLREQGMEFEQAIIEASAIRLRPIIMTGITTAAGSTPLILSSGAGSETRTAIGVVIICGVLAATFFTVIVVPVAYRILARGTGSVGDVARALEKEEADFILQESDS